ncbi:MAG: multiheme c-type cytochrome [Saprospiraceae bacterium]
MRKPFKWHIILGIFVLLLMVYCTKTKPVEENLSQSPFLNLADSVHYVGQQVCISCHSNVHTTFSQTGMGQSFGKANREKSAAVFNEHALVYDDKNDFYYFPYFKDSVFYVDEFRLDGKDTVHKRTEQVDYIVGSGHHTNSHIIDINGYIYQAPITYYTQEKVWDLAPGFRDVKNERFSRSLDKECLTCHNHFPRFEEGSNNKVLDMPLGIQCERCHGPGSLHAKEKLAGNIVDTATTADYTIVNPKRLSRDLQMDLCMRCHLQGTTILQPGKSFFDFRPGMQLSSVMNTFLPRSTGSDRKFIMASQADRLKQSPCFKNSEMTCLSCHHPHQSVRTLPEGYFNQKCQNCHSSSAGKYL